MKNTKQENKVNLLDKEVFNQQQVDNMRNAAVQAANLLRVLANEDRLMLLCQLSQGEYCVVDLEQSLEIKQPTLSQQLGVLRRKGIVSTRREGKNIFYRISDNYSIKILDLLYKLYCGENCA